VVIGIIFLEQQVLILGAGSRLDGFRFRQLFQDLLLVLAEHLPGRFGRGLHGQDSF
jgi:hypothetical protein